MYTFLRTQVQRHPTPPALPIANWPYFVLSPRTTFSSCVPSPLMCFPVAFCFHTGTVSYLTQACFPSCWSNCHVLCQVLEYIVFSSCCSCSLPVCCTAVSLPMPPVPGPWPLFSFTSPLNLLHLQIFRHHPLLVSLLMWHCFAALDLHEGRR